MFCYLKKVFATILTILVTITFYNHLTSSYIILGYAAKYYLWLQLRSHFDLCFSLYFETDTVKLQKALFKAKKFIFSVIFLNE